jgi:hypothetical protein
MDCVRREVIAASAPGSSVENAREITALNTRY